MAKINLSDIQAAADKKFGDYEIHFDETGENFASFKPALRLAKDARRKLAAAVNLEDRIAKAVKEGDEDDDLYEMFKDAFRISEAKKGDFNKLAEAVGDDPAVWTDLFNDFGEATQAGEAAPSES